MVSEALSTRTWVGAWGLRLCFSSVSPQDPCHKDAQEAVIKLEVP